jgi:hypothetical protein
MISFQLLAMLCPIFKADRLLVASSAQAPLAPSPASCSPCRESRPTIIVAGEAASIKIPVATDPRHELAGFSAPHNGLTPVSFPSAEVLAGALAVPFYRANEYRQTDSEVRVADPAVVA